MAEGRTGRPASCLTCDSKDLQVSTPARSHCRLRRFSIMMCPKRSPMFTCRDRRLGVSTRASSPGTQDTTPHRDQVSHGCHPGQAVGGQPPSTLPVVSQPTATNPSRRRARTRVQRCKAAHCSTVQNRRTWNELKYPSFGLK